MKDDIVKIVIDNEEIFKIYSKKYFFTNELFSNELKVLEKLSKKNILNTSKLLRVEKKEEENILVMSKIEGETLEKCKNLDLKEKIDLFKKLLYIVREIHNVGIVHNDISLSNVLYNFYSKEVYLIDFTVSKIMTLKSKEIMSTTDGYSPIEKYSKKYNSYYTTDIYSLTSILYYLITNNHPQKSYYQFHPFDDFKLENSKLKTFFKDAYNMYKANRIDNINEYITRFLEVENEILQLQ